MHVNLTIVFVGLLVGTFIGVSGVGGSSLMTPLLIILLKIHPVVAVGTDLVYSVPTKIVGTLVHGRQHTVDKRLVIALASGGIPAAIVGLGVAAWAKNAFSLDVLDALVRQVVGIALLISAAVLLVGLFLRRTPPSGETTPAWDRASATKAVLVGIIVGFCVSLTSIGSGAVTLPALYALLPSFGLRLLIGTDVAFAALLIPVAALGHLLMGNVDLGLAGNLVIGSVPGVVLGSKLCRLLPEGLLRPTVAGILVFAGLRLI
jgi:uncharacterized protein